MKEFSPFYAPRWEDLFGPIVNRANTQADASAAAIAPKPDSGGMGNFQQNLQNAIRNSIIGRLFFGQRQQPQQQQTPPLTHQGAGNVPTSLSTGRGIPRVNQMQAVYGNPDYGFQQYLPGVSPLFVPKHQTDLWNVPGAQQTTLSPMPTQGFTAPDDYFRKGRMR